MGPIKYLFCIFVPTAQQPREAVEWIHKCTRFEGPRKGLKNKGVHTFLADSNVSQRSAPAFRRIFCSWGPRTVRLCCILRSVICIQSQPWRHHYAKCCPELSL